MEIPDLAARMAAMADEPQPDGVMRIVVENTKISVTLHPQIPGGKIMVVQVSPHLEVHVPFNMAAAQVIGRGLVAPTMPGAADGNGQEKPAT